MDGSTVSPVEDIFRQLAALPRWVSYKLTFNEKRGKYDKIPYGGPAGLSTTNPEHWTDLTTAATTVAEQYGLAGVGLVLTGGIAFEGRTLIGFDFDGITTPEWTPPFKTYTELSPSKKGARAFAWVPTVWAKQFQDTLNTTPPHCEHAEIYLGTAPRFLTVTFDNLNQEPIAELKGSDLLLIEKWGLHLREEPKAETATPSFNVAGTPVDLKNRRFKFTESQKHLINGTGDIDRSDIMHGFLIKLLDLGVSQEDALATMVNTETLWAYCLSHRNDNEDKAAIFAREEISRAWAMSIPGKREALTSFNKKRKGDKPVTTLETATPTRDFPMDIYSKAPGLVGEVARWILAACYVPREEFAYAAALSMVACMVGPYCTHGAGTRRGKTNLYLTLVGGSGTGKTEAMSGMNLLMAETDAKDCIMELPASEAALRRQLTVTPNVLLLIDELAHKLEGMKEGSNASAMGGALLKGYDGGRMPPKVYADSKNSLPAVDNPFVQVLGGTTDKVWDVVKASHLEDGTLNRFVFVCLEDEPDYRHNPKPDGTVPKDLKDRLNTFFRAGKMADLVGDVPGFGRHISYDADVEKALDDLDKAMWKLQQGEFGNLYPRVTQNTMKIASIIAIGDGRESVAMRDFEQAQAFMKWSVAKTHQKVSGNMANSWFEKKMKSVVRKLEKAVGRKLTMRSIYKDLGLKRRDADDVIDALDAAGLATKEPPDGWIDDGEEWVWLL